MAHTKSQGAVKGNRDSISKRLGVKVYGGQKVLPGNIVVRQKGTKFFAGNGISMGSDFTLYAIKEGLLNFRTVKGKKFIEVTNG